MATLTLPINTATDTVRETVKVTSGYFSDGVGQLNGANIYTSSIADSNEEYYFNVSNTHPNSSSAADQFSVTWGHYAGSGSDTQQGNVVGASELIYKQWTSLLLGHSEITGGFRISGGDGSYAKPTNSQISGGARDEHVWVFVGKRARYKDRINVGNWTIRLSGSHASPGDVNTIATGIACSSSMLLELTDDSNAVTPVATPVGNRYNIVSGSNGSVSGSGYLHKVYGWFYPEVGAMIFSGAELSSSIGGDPNGAYMTASFNKVPNQGSTGLSKVGSFSSCSGFIPNLDSNGDPKNALKFINCLVRNGSYIKMRSEEEQNAVSYFCRVFANDMNHSNNPTFVSGSNNEIRNVDMQGNPQVFITGVNLYSSGGELVAAAKLSTPIKKNFYSEATIKVKLTY